MKAQALALFLILFAVFANAIVCESGTPVISMSAERNAHAGVVDEYINILCPGAALLAMCDEDNTFLRLSDTTNAHVQTKDLATYSEELCMELNGEQAYCDATVAGCPSNRLEIASISNGEGALQSMSNAHIGTFDVYPTKICCGPEPLGDAVGCEILYQITEIPPEYTTTIPQIIEDTTIDVVIRFFDGEFETTGCGGTFTLVSDNPGTATANPATSAITGISAGSTTIRAGCTSGAFPAICDADVYVAPSTVPPCEADTPISEQTVNPCSCGGAPRSSGCCCDGTTFYSDEADECAICDATEVDYLQVYNVLINPRHVDPEVDDEILISYDVMLLTHSTATTDISIGGAVIRSDEDLAIGVNSFTNTLLVEDWQEVAELAGGVFTIPVHAAPLPGETVTGNNTSNSTAITIGTGEGGATKATPEIPPIFVVFIAIAVILLIGRKS